MKKIIVRASFWVLLIAFANSLYAQNIITVCGNGLAGYYGDGGPATLAQLTFPCGMAADTSGNVLFCDPVNNCVRSVSPLGIITRIAGNGVSGYGGDGGQATNASFNNPRQVVADKAGNIYIADVGNGFVRCINASGIITTVAGNAFGVFPGDGGSATMATLGTIGGICVDSSGNLFISDNSNNIVHKVNSSGIINTVAGNSMVIGGGYTGDGITATHALLNAPGDLKISPAGELLIADSYNHRIRSVDASGIIHTVFVDSMVGYSIFPNFLAVDSAGNIFIADESYTSKVYKVSTGGSVTAFAGNGSFGFSGDGFAATSAMLNSPNGIAFDAAGYLYVADVYNNRIRKVNTTGVISTFAGGSYAGFGDGGTAMNAQLQTPVWATRDVTGNLYIADVYPHRVRKVNASGVMSTVAGTGTPGFSGDGGLASAAELINPYTLDFDHAGNLYICDEGANVIRKVNTAGVISTIAGTGGTAGFGGDGGPATASLLNGPVNIKVDQNDRVFICDRLNHRIRMIDTSGFISTIAGTGISGSTGDGGPANAAEIASPHGITFDAAGNLYFTDVSVSVIRKINTSGIISTIAGTGVAGYSGDGGPSTNAQLAFPCALAVNTSGDLFVSDGSNNRIRKIDASGTINTVIGTGVAGFSGDGGPAGAAKINNQYGITLDNAGNMYIADWGNHRVREVVYSLSALPVDIHGEAISIYPNPGSGSFSVHVNAQDEIETTLSITDMTGKILDTRPIKTNTDTTVNLDLPDGIYIFSLSLKEGQVAKKVIVMK